MSPDLNFSYREFCFWLLGKRKRFRITGMSMQPLLQPGEEVLLDPNAYNKVSPQVNDLVVAIHPQQPNLEIIKRVYFLTEGNKFFLIGENLAHSSDSRSFGAVARDKILGKVTSRFNFK